MPFINAELTRTESRTHILNSDSSYKCCQHFIDITDRRDATYNVHTGPVALTAAHSCHQVTYPISSR